MNKRLGNAYYYLIDAVSKLLLEGVVRLNSMHMVSDNLTVNLFPFVCVCVWGGGGFFHLNMFPTTNDVLQSNEKNFWFLWFIFCLSLFGQA